MPSVSLPLWDFRCVWQATSHPGHTCQSGVGSNLDGLRKGLSTTGSMLPVELWFLEDELPTQKLGAALQAKGATLRMFPPRVQHLGGFALKAAALLLSGFEEVPLHPHTPHQIPCCMSPPSYTSSSPAMLHTSALMSHPLLPCCIPAAHQFLIIMCSRMHWSSMTADGEAREPQLLF